MALNFANNNSLSAITTLPASITGGAMTLISEQTASSSATIDFTSGIDSTYDSYVFKFINIHPVNNDINFQFNMSTDGGSTYAVTKTTTMIRSQHNESDASATLTYQPSHDLAQSTAFQTIMEGMGNGADESGCGTLTLFNPSSTTYVKHFISNCNSYRHNDVSDNWYTAGYGNTTSSVNSIQFKFASGNIDSGVIKLYGIS